MNPELQLRDIHLPPEPSWWPPAPGWWLLAMVLCLLAWHLTRLGLRHWRARQRRLALVAEFDSVLTLSGSAVQLAAISQLLRRAARSSDPAAASLVGSAWLEFLDRSADSDSAPFSQGPGKLLLDGPYRMDPDPASVAALIAPARQCFLRLVRAE
ncbi:MAG TPA: DUF4381 domain-containing protein [Xanthomonadales bacterium]|nr:DUF4381 domain-containing protein [Xanthomonadales bacterium]